MRPLPSIGGGNRCHRRRCRAADSCAGRLGVLLRSGTDPASHRNRCGAPSCSRGPNHRRGTFGSIVLASSDAPSQISQSAVEPASTGSMPSLRPFWQIAVGLVTIRALSRWSFEGLSWLGAKVPRIGRVSSALRRVLQQPMSARLPVLAIVLCISVAAFCRQWFRPRSAEGQEVSSWQAGRRRLLAQRATDPTPTLLGSRSNWARCRLTRRSLRAEATTFGNAEALIEFGVGRHSGHGHRHRLPMPK